MKHETKPGLALGGGAVLGAAHLGVIRAFEELEIVPAMVSGTSIGSFVAALLAFGKSWNEIAGVIQDFDWLDLSGLSISQFGLLSNKKFGSVVNDLLGQKNIEDAAIPLAIVATDISTGRKVVLEKGDVAMAVMASSCIPGLFRPVDYAGALLVDGVLMENVPVSPLVEHGLSPVVCVDLLARHAFSRPENIVGLLLNSFYSAVTNTTRMQTAAADLCITPDLSAFNLIDMAQIPDIIEVGYREAIKALGSS
ncbi:MAG: patatin-like phospholipase family protein [Chlorobium sp.]|nr:patatin-like phospholipase family protein [Chlorobium phaeovibrioides]NQU45691.1 patatin-like phospholipase family protein [Chlorobium sp.]